MHNLCKLPCADTQESDAILIAKMLADLPDYFSETGAFSCDQGDPAKARETLALLKGPRRARLSAVPVPANDDAPAESSPPPAAPADSAPRRLSKKSKSSAARPRRSVARDRRNVSKIKGFVSDVRPLVRERAADPLVGTPPTSPTPPSSPSAPPTSTINKRKRADERDTRKAPAWRYTTEIVRGHCAIRTISTTGAGLSWSLNLGGKVLQAANDNPARFVAQMQDRLAKGLKAAFGEVRDFLFFIEITAAGRPHLHGAVDATMNERDAVAAVLARCGGTWDSAHHRDKQVHVADLWCADGWVRYSAKDAARTRAALGLKSVLTMTRGCRARAEALWEASRKHSEDKSTLIDFMCEAKIFTNPPCDAEQPSVIHVPRGQISIKPPRYRGEPMHIVNTEKLRAVAEAILRLEPCMVTGEVDPDQIRVTICEGLDIWPASIFGANVAGEEPKRPEPDRTEDDAEARKRRPAPSTEPDFISEEEDENPAGVDGYPEAKRAQRH